MTLKIHPADVMSVELIVVVCDENLGVIEMGEHDWDVFELVERGVFES